MSMLSSASFLPTFVGRFVCALILAALTGACGDVASQHVICDEAYCVDCSDPCCYDLGYC